MCNLWQQNVRHAARRCSTAPCPTAPRALATLATRCERGAAPAAFEQHQPRSAARGSSIRQQELVKSTKGYTVQTAEPILDELISRPLCRRGQRRRTPASSSSSSLRVEPILFAAIQFSEEHHILAKCRVALRRRVMPHDHACSGRLGIRRALACAADSRRDRHARGCAGVPSGSSQSSAMTTAVCTRFVQMIFDVDL